MSALDFEYPSPIQVAVSIFSIQIVEWIPNGIDAPLWFYALAFFLWGAVRALIAKGGAGA